ncbi:transcriptional regulator [Paenibacillus sp. BIHB 4019]|uniref:Transcriptional regulator n=1 Tax=Paenibacillus sp. BIHB 4019 TaxID=1870819 RepID=A0A1B2DD36_9BACL|nr:TetR/AcrR family transcriptional regulator [Paenibacillus sp. BIHB 4019]ANY65634.1 transcriptional regulator [Paenibacillus sp. BIHB 4019]
MAKRAMTNEAKALKAQSILDKAVELFTSYDYEQIKMSDIAKEMNMSKGILFVYFKTKESLFFHLLTREYEKRLQHLMNMIIETRINNEDDFKQLVMKELIELVDHNPLYIRLESIRTSVLEKNIDAEVMLELKSGLYNKMIIMTNLLCDSGIVTEAAVMDIFQAEASIITGCKLSATLPNEVIEIIERNGMHGFKRDFKADVMDTMSYYLDGYFQGRR